MIRYIIAFYISIITFTSCKPLLLKFYGVKTPRIETDNSVIALLNKRNIDYDYLFRIKDNSMFNKVNQELNANNVIMTTDSNLNLIITEDTNLCHMGVRSTTTQLIKDNSLMDRAKIRKNLSPLFKQQLNCLNAKENQLIFKPIVVILTYAKFLGFNEKVTDIDYIQELQQQGLRDKVSIILINMDLVE